MRNLDQLRQDLDTGRRTLRSKSLADQRETARHLDALTDVLEQAEAADCDPSWITCDTCNGHGRFVMASGIIPCQDCNGATGTWRLQ